MRKDMIRKSLLIILLIGGLLASNAIAGEENPAIFRKDVSKTPEMASDKAKLNIMGVWFPVYRADGTPATYTATDGSEQSGIAYYDQDGYFIRSATKAKPLVITYTDAIPGYYVWDKHGNPILAHDVFAAVSRDDGETWKRMNLSRMADESSFVLANGETYYGHCRKPVMHVKSNKIFVTWSSKYAKGGTPRYTIEENEPYYTEDIFGVAGNQQSVDYEEQDIPEAGEVPYSAVWTCRGIIVTSGMIKSSSVWAKYYEGEIVWFKPERLTSGRRDAYQLFAGGSSKGDFGIVWQEDPEGLWAGKGFGPGDGWSGARAHKHTDIWYSYITYKDVAKVDTTFVPSGDPDHDDPEFVGRLKAKVPMSLPVRITDNLNVNTNNAVFYDEDGNPIEGTGTKINEDKEGERVYINKVLDPDLWCYDPDAEEPYNGFYEYTNQQGEAITAAVTCDGRLLDGDTGASRPNLFLQTYCAENCKDEDPDNDVYSAYAIMGYEETKGLGSGPTEEEDEHSDVYKCDEGKNIHYHSFDFQNPDLVSDGNILNLQTTDAEGNPLWLVDEEGNEVLDHFGDPIPAYQNARRVRFVMQGKGAIGPSKTIMLALYKEGEEGKGWPSDIMMRRCEVTSKGNPYAFKHFVDGIQNLSSNNCSNWIIGESSSDDTNRTDFTKVTRWTQTEDNLGDQSWTNPYEDARAHRGQIRGDKVLVGYIYTPNWYASRNYNDKYDFYIRRSFDGGETWTTACDEDIDHDGDGFSEREGDCNDTKKSVKPNPDFPDTYCYAETCTGDLVGTVTHTDIYPDPDNIYDSEGNPCNVDGSPCDPEAQDDNTRYEVETSYEPGDWEPARNVSLLRNNDKCALEPRAVACQGTIKIKGEWTKIPEDKQNKNVFYLTYGMEANDETQAKLDMFWTVTTDWGQSLKWIEKEISPDSSGDNAGETVFTFDWLAKNPDAEEAEAQVRMTPSGERMYVCYLEESSEKSDVTFRRIMDPAAFDANVAPVPGDIDGDGDVDMSDVYALYPYMNQPASALPEGDIDGDGRITVLDVRQLYLMAMSN